MSNKNISGKQVFNSISWMLLQTGATKLTAILGQIVLAWLLLPEQFGLISLVYTVTTIGMLIQQFGLNDVLVRRQKSFNNWLPLSFGISWIFGIISFLLLLILGFIGSKIYHDNNIFILVSFYAFTTPMDALSVIPLTKLRIDLDFKTLSIIRVMETVMTMVLTVILADLGLGVYSFVIPPLIVSAVSLIVKYRITHLKILFNLHLKRWKYLTVNSSWSLMHSVIQRIMDQTDTILLGILVSKTIVGIYYMAFSLSIQVIGFVANNLPQVLFPSLASIKDSKRAKEIYKKSVTYLSVFGAAFAIWQGATAFWLVRVLLSSKWVDTTPLVEILSIGMAFRAVAWLWSIPFRVTGRFSGMAKHSFYSLLFMIALVTAGTLQWGVYGTAAGVSLYYTIISPYWLYKGFKLLGGTLPEALQMFIIPIPLALFSYGSCWYFFRFMYTGINPVTVMIIISLAGTTFYIMGIYLLMNDTFQEIRRLILERLPVNSGVRKLLSRN
ncbi:Membrane protein involved in the export of O-antigen and teichoic acid [Chitinophaga sp. CF118]|uniref:oligosaccharide flippase family protein n=1 Tax=Chitinophaga sp. CF118 TaxID=1884367 RepID=UPI0008F2B42B|nr:oligosaccharide flippase family protein [Chitinophaga sp. CF118]SFE03022.1 Membrane protein involved in the export of O-antigen and teichoic acid [Chitinophaga sp. CF118]